jgi:drug/metabolite transporter (DMT)-like permease
MTSHAIHYVFLTTSVTLMSSVQIILKYRMSTAHGPVPSGLADLIRYVAGFLRDPWICVAAICVLSASFLWYYALSRLPLNVTFAFTALSYPIVFLVSWLAFKETISLTVALGYFAIVIGIMLIGWGTE